MTETQVPGSIWGNKAWDVVVCVVGLRDWHPGIWGVPVLFSNLG